MRSWRRASQENLSANCLLSLVEIRVARGLWAVTTIARHCQASGVIEECGSCYGRINRMFPEEICRELKLIRYCVLCVWWQRSLILSYFHRHWELVCSCHHGRIRSKVWEFILCRQVRLLREQEKLGSGKQRQEVGGKYVVWRKFRCGDAQCWSCANTRRCAGGVGCEQRHQHKCSPMGSWSCCTQRGHSESHRDHLSHSKSL